MEIEEIQIRETIKLEFKELLRIDIKYPEFLPADKFAFINAFYKSLAEKYHAYAVNTHFPEVVKRYELSDDPRKRFKYKAESITMNFTVTLTDDELISVEIDVGHHRLSQAWKGDLIITQKRSKR